MAVSFGKARRPSEHCGRALFAEFNTREGEREGGQFIRPSPEIARKGSLAKAEVYSATPLTRARAGRQAGRKAGISDPEAGNVGCMHKHAFAVTKTLGLLRVVLSPITSLDLSSLSYLLQLISSFLGTLRIHDD